MKRQGKSIKSGDIITTGTCTGLTLIENPNNDEIKANFDGFGEMCVNFVN